MARFTYTPNRVIDTDGISDGASIYFYATGTTTPITIYSDAGLTTPIANPVVVAAGGAVPVVYYADAEIRVRVVDSGGSVVSDDDPYENLRNDLASTTASRGAALVGTTGGSTVQAELDDRIYLQANIDKSIGAAIDSTLSGSFVVSSYSGTYPNKVGVNNTKPTDEPLTGARTADSAYTPGAAAVSAVLGGYDNVSNALASFICSQHSMIYTGGDHASIWGGSLNTIKDDADYSVVVGGTSNTIEERGRYAAIIAGNECRLITGASDSVSGFRGLIATSQSCTANGRNAVILSSVSSSISSTYGCIFAGESVTLTNGTHMGAGGNTITMGATSPATYSFAWGLSLTVDGSRSVAMGEGHVIGVGHEYSTAFGFRCVTPFIGARVHSSRQRGNTAGNNMALDWSASQETTDATATRLSAAGSANYPTQPANSIVTGTVWVTGAKDDGTSSAFKIDFSSLRVGTGTPTIKATATATLHNDLALGTVPVVVSTTGGIYRVEVVGLAATNIRWMARFVGQQVVWG